jgi:hypothetical protein
LEVIKELLGAANTLHLGTQAAADTAEATKEKAGELAEEGKEKAGELKEKAGEAYEVTFIFIFHSLKEI